MNYQLARELKEVGFPQKGPDFNWLEGDWEEVYTPTLSELIAACGDRFSGLINMCEKKYDPGSFTNLEGHWTATGKRLSKYHQFKTRPEGWGPTPEEAVARLWLSLNKK